MAIETRFGRLLCGSGWMLESQLDVEKSANGPAFQTDLVLLSCSECSV